MEKLEKRIICDSCQQDCTNNHHIIHLVVTQPISYLDIETKHYCPTCYKRIQAAANWSKHKNDLVSLNFNEEVEMTLGKDSAESFNNYYKDCSLNEYKEGDVIRKQLHTILRASETAVRKIRCSYQELAKPFEIRIPLKNLKEVKTNDDND